MARVAIVEDMPEIIKDLQDLLQTAGHEVLAIGPIMTPTWMPTMAEVVTRIQEFSPDVVLLDNSLGSPYEGRHLAPKLDGFRIINISGDAQPYGSAWWTGKRCLRPDNFRYNPILGEELLKLL